MKTMLAVVFAVVTVVAFSAEIAAQDSCAALFGRCKSRCPEWSKEPLAKCTADHCSPKLATCRKTGCWTEGPRFGGGTVQSEKVDTSNDLPPTPS